LQDIYADVTATNGSGGCGHHTAAGNNPFRALKHHLSLFGGGTAPKLKSLGGSAPMRLRTKKSQLQLLDELLAYWAESSTELNFRSFS